jgi:hypothetical protein
MPNIDCYLKQLGFAEPTWGILKDTKLELHFNGHFIAYDGDKFHFIRTSPDRCYSGISFDDITHRKMKKAVLVCKALNEIRKTEWGFGDGYCYPIIEMVVWMFLSNKQNARDVYLDASGNQTYVAEGFIKKIRHGEWWETK